jgi:hypothetical protein
MAAPLPITSTSSIETQAQITSLRTTFAAMVVPTVARYTELVGSSMAAALQRDLNDVAQTNHWEVQFTVSGVTDTHPFETPDAAARAHRILARTIINHMAIVIGARLANSIMHEVTQQLDPAQHQLVQSYHLVPDNILSGSAR